MSLVGVYLYWVNKAVAVPHPLIVALPQYH